MFVRFEGVCETSCGILPQCDPPQEIRLLIWPYEGMMVVHNPSIRPSFLVEGGIGGVPLDSHDCIFDAHIT